jgi:hypothetical protein
MLLPRSILVLIGVLAVGSAANAAPLAFKGAELGISLDAWRSLAPPEGVGPDATPACASDPAIARIAHNPMSARPEPNGLETCAYVDLFGDTVLPHTILLDHAYRAGDLQYLFDHGRLSEIRFDAPIDAFSDVMVMLRNQYGAPISTVRDSVPTPDGRLARVTDVWRTVDGAVTLTDPSAELTQLSVTIAGRDHQRIAAGDGAQSATSTRTNLELSR